MANSNNRPAGANQPHPERSDAAVAAGNKDSHTASDAAPKVEAEPFPVTAPGEAKAGGDTIKVETTGNFMIYDPYTGDVVEHEGVSEVRDTSFIRNKISEGQLKEV